MGDSESTGFDVVSDWWMYHGDPQHSGCVTGSRIDSTNAANLETVASLELDGPILSVPAVVGDYVYVGIANSHQAPGSNGGSFYKIALADGSIAARYDWDLAEGEIGDSHGFTGMGCTPAVTKKGGQADRVYFTAFNGKLYCLAAADLAEQWILDLRHADLSMNQPVTNTAGTSTKPTSFPAAAGWSSPLVVDGTVYLGIGEGENPFLYSFLYAVDAASGRVQWIYCTNQYQAGVPNEVNHLPKAVLQNGTPPGFTAVDTEPITMGCSPWSGIAHDAKLDRLFITLGNAVPDGPLPSPGYSNGLLSLDRKTGAFRHFWQVPAESNYRPSDFDIDVGGSPTLFLRDFDIPRATVAVACKNGGLFLIDAATFTLVGWRQMLPYTNDGLQIANVDPHPATSEPNPRVSNAQSNVTIGENYYGSYSTPTADRKTQTLFVGIGGNNYHTGFPGIDYETTPFLRAINWENLADSWPMDSNDPARYANAMPPMYTNPGEAGLSSAAVVNDVVFCSTSRVAVYAFKVADGTLLFQDVLGQQTQGLQGGYGYCMGPAVRGDYVVAGALIQGRLGGLLRIYRLPESTSTGAAGQAPAAAKLATGPEEIGLPTVGGTRKKG